MNERDRTHDHGGPGERAETDRTQVNPAARRDRPQDPPAVAPEDPTKDEQQVPPGQEEPLDPLGPGGIGG